MDFLALGGGGGGGRCKSDRGDCQKIEKNP